MLKAAKLRKYPKDKNVYRPKGSDVWCHLRQLNQWSGPLGHRNGHPGGAQRWPALCLRQGSCERGSSGWADAAGGTTNFMQSNNVEHTSKTGHSHSRSFCTCFTYFSRSGGCFQVDFKGGVPWQRHSDHSDRSDLSQGHWAACWNGVKRANSAAVMLPHQEPQRSHLRLPHGIFMARWGKKTGKKTGNHSVKHAIQPNLGAIPWNLDVSPK